MSLADEPRLAGDSSDTRIGPSTDVLIDLLSDEHARDILEAICLEPKSARDLVSECDASRTTVYRRLNRLQEAGLVREQMAYDSDGHHRLRFHPTVEHVTIELGETGFEAEFTTDGRPSPESRVSAHRRRDARQG